MRIINLSILVLLIPGLLLTAQNAANAQTKGIGRCDSPDQELTDDYYLTKASGFGLSPAEACSRLILQGPTACLLDAFYGFAAGSDAHDSLQVTRLSDDEAGDPRYECSAFVNCRVCKFRYGMWSPPAAVPPFAPRPLTSPPIIYSR